jgi:hypothetical protein
MSSSSKRKVEAQEEAPNKKAKDGLVNQRRVRVLKSGTYQGGPVIYW